MMRMVVSLAVASGVAAALGGDWTNWRGPNQNGAVPFNAVVTDWSLDGKNQLWKSPIGGRSTPVIQNGRLFLITPAGEGEKLGERVVCLDIDSGKTLWEYVFSVYHTDIVENRVGWTSLVVDPQTGNVYAHGTGGELFCLDRDGKLLWKRALAEEFGRFSGFGGRLYTPIIDQDKLIISFLNQSWGAQAPMGHRVLALDKRSGQVVWWAQLGERPMDTTYATPVTAVINGRRLLICPAADGWIHALNAHTGEPVWKYQFSARPLNSSVVVDGKYVFAAHGEENVDSTRMGRVACIDGSGAGDISKSGEVWRNDEFESRYPTPAFANGRLYVVDDAAKLYCLDAKTGKTIWQHGFGRVTRVSPVVTADGVIYLGESNGVFVILKDAGDKCQELARVQLPERNSAIDEIFGSPAVVDGRVYFASRYGTYCLGPKDAKVAERVGAPLPVEAPQADAKPKLLIYPADVTLAPGESLRLLARVHSEGGAKQQEAMAQWSVKGAAAQIGNDGTISAGKDNKPSAGLVTAKLDGMEATARVRICPKLPIAEDFEAYEPNGVPPGWINVAGKTAVVEKDGSKVLMHLAERPTPLFMRIRTFMTPSLAGGYTIEADLLGAQRPPHWKPDMGVVNSRYELLLLGSEPTLRLTSWPAVPRLQKDVPFEWAPEKWYRMKFQVRFEGGKGILRGKVWPRDQAEPSAWTIEAVDPFPNNEGSPALYGYAAGTTEKKKGAAMYFDNVKVMPNE